MKVGVVGLGYVGLSTLVVLASKFETVGVDVSEERVRELIRGKAPVHEKALGTLLAKGVRARRIAFSSRASELDEADAIFVTVGTPSSPNGEIDLSQVRKASTDLGAVVKASTRKPLVMVRSTVIPGTTSKVVRPLIEGGSGKKCGEGFGLCANPEFLREGSAIHDSLNPSRIVLGPVDEPSLAGAKSLYRRLYGKRAPPMVVTTPEGAELIKYGSNSLLAAKVSFINLISSVSETFPGTDVDDIALGIGLDPRIGKQFLQAGPGFGGSCFSKDLRAFSSMLKQLAIDPSMPESVLKINEFQPVHVVALAESAAGTLQGKKVAVLGLAFKAETSDTRDSRSIPLIKELLARGAKVSVYDPAAKLPSDPGVAGAVQATTAKQCLTDADLAITMTAWKEFQRIKPAQFAHLLRSPVLVDARRIYDPEAYSRELRYVAVGLGASRTR